VTGQPVGGVGGVAGKAFPVARSETRLLVPALMFIAPFVAAGTGPGHLFPDDSAYTTGQMYSSHHWRFHAQGLLGQRLPHHLGP
jgi:hypothetical protein